MKYIFFYNHFHNGDVFLTREYVREIAKLYPEATIKYFHGNSPKIIADLGIKTLNISEYNTVFDMRSKFIKDDGLQINTWIGNHLLLNPGCNYLTYNKMFKELIKDIGLDYDVKDPEYYIPDIDFSQYDIPNNFEIDDSAIMFSNGPVHSGQSNIGSTNEIVQAILDNIPDRKIILTHKTEIINDRLIYTDDIINTSGGDLNEISWVAEKCKTIIGRNSGPFCFMHTKNILNNSQKNIIAFGTVEEDCPSNGLKIECNYTFIDDSSSDLIEKILEKI